MGFCRDLGGVFFAGHGDGIVDPSIDQHFGFNGTARLGAFGICGVAGMCVGIAVDWRGIGRPAGLG